MVESNGVFCAEHTLARCATSSLEREMTVIQSKERGNRNEGHVYLVVGRLAGRNMQSGFLDDFLSWNRSLVHVSATVDR